MSVQELYGTCRTVKEGVLPPPSPREGFSATIWKLTCIKLTSRRATNKLIHGDICVSNAYRLSVIAV